MCVVNSITQTYKSGLHSSTYSSLPCVGQDDILRGGWLPPLFGCGSQRGPIDNRPQVNNLPHKSSRREQKFWMVVHNAVSVSSRPQAAFDVLYSACPSMLI